MGVFSKKQEVVKQNQNTFSNVAPIEKSHSIIGRTLSIKGEVYSDEEVLIEGKAKRGDLFQGKSRGFRNCLLPATDRLVGELVEMKVHRATQSSLYGDLILSGIEETETVTLSN